MHQPCQLTSRDHYGFDAIGAHLLRLGRGGAAGARLRLHLKRADVATYPEPMARSRRRESGSPRASIGVETTSGRTHGRQGRSLAPRASTRDTAKRRVGGPEALSEGRAPPKRGQRRATDETSLPRLEDGVGPDRRRARGARRLAQRRSLSISVCVVAGAEPQLEDPARSSRTLRS